MLTYRKSIELKFVGYADVDFAGGDLRKSTWGYIFTLVGGAISWKSSKQTITASSIMQPESLSCYMVVGQTIWLKKFVPGLRVVDNILRPLTIYCDNKSAVFFSSNNKSSDAARHIDIKYFVVKDRVQDQTVEIKHISTKQMLADPLMKSLPPNIFRDHVASMGLLESLWFWIIRANNATNSRKVICFPFQSEESTL
jgi:hypothetical protein